MKGDFLGFRADNSLRDFLKEKTASGLSMSETIRQAIEQFKPLPNIVYNGLRVVQEEYGLALGEAISRAVLAYLARCNAELELFGEEWGIDPFTVEVGPGKICENYEEFYGALFQARVDSLLGVDFFRKKHEEYLTSRHEIRDVRNKQ